MLIFPEVRHIPVKGQDETLRVPLTSIITCLLLQFSSPSPGFVITAQVIQILEILEERMNYELDLFGTIEPRQTIAEKIHQYGVKAISDCELIEGLIKPYLTARADIRKTALEVLETLNSADATLESLSSIKGVSRELASGILIALEVGRRKGERRKRAITCPADIYTEIRHFADEYQERFICMALNGAHEVLYSREVTKGLLNRTVIHPRECFTDAIKGHAAAIIIAHTHPSGNLSPSEDDKEITIRLVKAGELLGIKVLDHLIVTQDGYYSFLEHGLM